MTVRVVTDATCDLPREYIDANNMLLLPIAIRAGDAVLNDDRRTDSTLAFYRDHLSDKGVMAETVPWDVEQIRQFFLQQVVTSCDHSLCLTVTASRSPIFESATQASLNLLRDYKQARVQAGRSGPFAMRVLDSGNMFAGQGVLAAEAARMIADGMHAADLRKAVQGLIPKTWAYLIPSDLYYVRARAKKKGDKSVSFAKYALGTALNIRPILRCNQGETEAVASQRGGFESAAQRLLEAATARVRAGVLGHYACISYGGPLEDLTKLPGYAGFANAVSAAGLELISSLMSMTACVNVGEGALSIGLLADEPAI